jgi:asparagine synthase (glutamine-hydrolysing)
MCGICGIIRFDGTLDPGLIEAMKNRLVHRGPDDHGSYASPVHFGASTGAVVLGHRRLRVIDLSSQARQPMSNEDGTVWVTYNGEIYNFQDLRKELEGYGHVFRSRSDTEVIVHAYEQWGTSFVERCNGMFALGLWDSRNRRLVLVRDRLGVKPLYYYFNGKELAFASELKALLVVPSAPRQVDLQAIADYFTWQFIPAPRTIFSGIRKLLPGRFLVVTETGIEETAYWNLARPNRTDPPRSEGSYIEQLTDLLDDAVRIRLVSDVPLGAFLSGGIDSSIIVGLMGRRSGERTRTFTMGFECNNHASEMPWAQEVADRYRTDHQVRVVKPRVIPELLGRLAWFMDEPFADHSIIPTYLLSEFARESVTVALSGDGGDENFGGYPRRYGFARSYGQYLRLPGWIRRPGEALARAACSGMLAGMGDTRRAKRLRKLRDMMGADGAARIVTLDSIVAPSTKAHLLHPDVAATTCPYPALPEPESRRSDSSDLPADLMRLDIENYLSNDVLTKVDRMSMAHSLEVRNPLLDYRVVDLAATIPVSLKLRSGQTKYILKRTFEGLLPDSIRQRGKQGFGIPVKHWMAGDLSEFGRQILLDDRVRKRAILNPKTLETMIEQTRTGRCNYGTELWASIMLELWYRAYVD